MKVSTAVFVEVRISHEKTPVVEINHRGRNREEVMVDSSLGNTPRQQFARANFAFRKRLNFCTFSKAIKLGYTMGKVGLPMWS